MIPQIQKINKRILSGTMYNTEFWKNPKSTNKKISKMKIRDNLLFQFSKFKFNYLNQQLNVIQQN